MGTGSLSCLPTRAQQPLLNGGLQAGLLACQRPTSSKDLNAESASILLGSWGAGLPCLGGRGKFQDEMAHLVRVSTVPLAGFDRHSRGKWINQSILGQGRGVLTLTITRLACGLIEARFVGERGATRWCVHRRRSIDCMGRMTALLPCRVVGLVGVVRAVSLVNAVCV